MNQIALTSGATIIAHCAENEYISINMINKGCFYTMVLDKEENTVSVQKIAKKFHRPIWEI